ncbi:hypothetical protein Godav_005637 [Gossypium davidsonii]|uniref:Uncharacterized protein n=1 Tax=Gossypium davidsonii TaxID=34287 RepID=A0A7J8S1A8_GOSDV|nr:hypothetical protein [Gossypium davidsonii]
MWTKVPFANWNLMKLRSNSSRMLSRTVIGLNSVWVCLAFHSFI